MSYLKNFLVVAVLLPVAILAQVAGVEVAVSNVTAPPGGVAQVQIVLTEPKPITTGALTFSFDSGPLDSVLGVTSFSPAGDTSGAATIQGNQIRAFLNSPSGTLGTLLGYPILAIAFAVDPKAQPGQTAQLTIDPSNLFGIAGDPNATAAGVKPGLFTVGGSLSINNVVPGAGLLPAGTPVSVLGLGFHPRTKIQVGEATVTSTQLVGSSQILVTLGEDIQLHGARFRAVNPDGFRATYFSYHRAHTIGHSADPLLAATVPIFPEATFTEAAMSPVITGVFGGASLITGLAFQNPNPHPAGITLQVYSPDMVLLGETSFAVPGGARILREVTEWLPGLAPQQGGFVHFVSTLPVQMLALAGNEDTGALLPVTPTAVQPGAFPPAP